MIFQSKADEPSKQCSHNEFTDALNACLGKAGIEAEDLENEMIALKEQGLYFYTPDKDSPHAVEATISLDNISIDTPSPYERDFAPEIG